MSAGPFTTSRYELNNGTIVPIKVQPETILFSNGTISNGPPAGAVTLSLFAKARKGNREYGIGARTVTIAWDAAPPTGYANENLTIPVLTPDTFDAYPIGEGVTYLETAATVVGRKSESLR